MKTTRSINQLARRSILLHGLVLTLRRPGALLWTYAFNLLIALLFSLRFVTQLQSFLAHSLASQTLTSGFDFGTAMLAIVRLNDNAPSTGSTNYLSIPVYALVYFILVPGTLFSYQTAAPAKLSTLLGSGLLHFWRFLRITLLTLIVGGLILGPLFALQGIWVKHVDQTQTGSAALWQEAPSAIFLALLALFLRLYFDLVAAYTIQIGLHIRPNGQPDRRVRRTLLPAIRVLARNLVRTYFTFAFLTILGLAALFFSLRTSLHTLAQPRVWPLFLLAQLGLFVNLFARFWQRAAETILVQDNPIPPEPTRIPMQEPTPLPPDQPPPVPEHLIDPIPNPEPASPSLPNPDPEIYESR